MRNHQQDEGTDTGTGNPDHLIALRDKALREFPVEWVPIETLTVSSTPRVDGEDLAYARALAESGAALPPILVHRATMQVVDGVHRLRAARIRGADCVEVRFFDGTEAESFPLSVAINVAQGRPLSSTDRTVAVTRILASHPHWSDRGSRPSSDCRRRRSGTSGGARWIPHGRPPRASAGTAGPGRSTRPGPAPWPAS